MLNNFEYLTCEILEVIPHKLEILYLFSDMSILPSKAVFYLLTILQFYFIKFPSGFN